MRKFYGLILVFIAGLILLSGCGKSAVQSDAKATKKQTVVKLGVVGQSNEVWEDVANRLEEANIHLEIISFGDYTQPNAALQEGELDLNAFQHQFFLDNYNKEHQTDLISIGNTLSAPLGIYSEKYSDIKDIEAGSEIAIPNDATNGGRALLLLQTAGLLKINPAKAKAPTVTDIIENPKKLQIKELDASQTARALADTGASIINSGMAVDAGINPKTDAIFLEPVDSSSRPYVNIIAARKQDATNPVYQKVVAAYQQDSTKSVIEKAYKGANIPAWETFGKK